MKKSKHAKAIQARKQEPHPPSQGLPSRLTFLIYDLIEKRGFLLLLFFVLSVAMVVFWDFLTLRKVLLFKDIGSDSINFFYARFVHLAEYFRIEGLPRWSFNLGMGQNLFAFSISDPSTILYSIVGKDAVAYAIVYAELLKIILAGFFFYLYLKVLKLSGFTALVGGLLYSFGGYQLMETSGWYNISIEPMFASMLLYAFEKFFRQRVWWPFPLVVALIGAYQPFLLYLYGIFLAGYAFLRYLDEEGWRLRALSPLILRATALAFLGIAISSVLFLSNFVQVLQSPRVGGEASYFKILSSQPVLKFAEPIQYISAVSRTLSTDLLGTGNSFRGWMNYAESPASYCGLVTLLLAPQFFLLGDRRRRWRYAVPLTLFVIGIAFPFFRYLFWGFTGDYFRTFSFFLSVLLLFLGLHALHTIESRNTVSVKGLLTGAAVAFLMLYLPVDNWSQLIDRNLRTVIAGFFIAYTILLAMLQSKTYRGLAKAGLLIAICIELAYLSSITVNKRDVLTSRELKQKTGFNDYSNEAVAYLNSTDKEFFRVNKTYSSGPAMHASLNDAMVQGYYGTTQYNQFNQKYYIRFLEEMNIIHKGSEWETRWARGVSTRPLLHSFASVKYTLSKDENADLAGVGYEFVKTVGDVHIYRNRYFLPLGFTYDRYVSLKDFSTFSPFEKDKTLLRAFVAEGADSLWLHGLNHYGTRDTSSEYTFAEYERDIAERRNDTLAISKHGQNVIEGTITLQQKKLLFFSIPYDAGWSAFVDGKKSPIELVNIGFSGVVLDKGKHSVRLEYEPPYLRAGAAVSVAALLLYGFLLYWQRKKRSPVDTVKE
jgi:uncharacterized membrane protein YfhO